MFSADGAQQALLDLLEPLRGGKIAWVADEHPLADALLNQLAQAGAHLVTNRIDQFQRARQFGVAASFNDFDLTPPNEDWDAILFRIAKEKAVVHRVINEALRYLKPRGLLALSGFRSEGIKTYLTKAAEAMASSPRLDRGPDKALVGQLHLFARGEPLDDQNYSHLHRLQMADGHHYWTKPGLFGWQKLDQGSAFLVDTLVLEDDLHNLSVLDLGCGYGYLATAAAHQGASRIVATDNCAAAVLACSANLEQAATGYEYSCFASDCAAESDEQFDRILCNPPFHAGFGAHQPLHEKFVQSIGSHLQRKGEAWVVVNQFLRLDQLFAAHHLEVVDRRRNSSNQFDLYRIRQSR